MQNETCFVTFYLRHVSRARDIWRISEEKNEGEKEEKRTTFYIWNNWNRARVAFRAPILIKTFKAKRSALTLTWFNANPRDYITNKHVNQPFRHFVENQRARARLAACAACLFCDGHVSRSERWSCTSRRGASQLSPSKRPYRVKKRN